MPRDLPLCRRPLSPPRRPHARRSILIGPRGASAISTPRSAFMNASRSSTLPPTAFAASATTRSPVHLDRATGRVRDLDTAQRLHECLAIFHFAADCFRRLGDHTRAGVAILGIERGAATVLLLERRAELAVGRRVEGGGVV